MRLKSVKLAGFKSFVDPTTISLKSNLSAIVGPNGSGKSNIIDAVRWVMGERSAKYLRGESMSDVIFNGSSDRKPSAHASVELIFDNSEGNLKGQYGSYETLSFKREVTRDGHSNYLLNGSRCRQKDIKEFFMGTGLGPRSYAIIMQNTISRLVEAKPEELRGYIEEVAGIAKYKDRRRETELRIKHTRENLERLTDLRDELEKQCNRLNRQAKAAERYKVLKGEERLTKGQLHAIQWQAFNTQLNEQQQLVLEGETAVDAAIAEVRRIDADFEMQREAQIERSESVNEAQAQYYSIGAEVGRLEQAKQHQNERQQQLNEDYEQALLNFESAKMQLSSDQETCQMLENERVTLQPELEERQEQAELAQEKLSSADESLQEWQGRWDEFNERSSRLLKEAEVEQTRIEHLQRRQDELTQRLEQLREQEQSSQPDEMADEKISELQESVVIKGEEQEHLQDQIDQHQNDIHHHRESLQKVNNQLDGEKARLQQLRGKHSALEALQQSALGQQDNSDVTKWLQDRDLATRPRIAEEIEVASGWERAVETVLGRYLEAVSVDDLGSVTGFLSELQKGQITFVDNSALIATPDTSSLPQDTQSLAEKVTSFSAISALLSNIICADTVSEALLKIKQLQPHQSVMTKEGIWIGQGWVRIHHDEESESGVIQRQQALVQLKDEIGIIEQRVIELESEKSLLNETLRGSENQLHESNQQVRQSSAELADLQAQLKVHQAEIERHRHRASEIATAMHQAKERLEQTTGDLTQSRDIWQDALSKSEGSSETRQRFLDERETLRNSVENHRAQLREGRELTHQLALRFESVKTRIQSLKENIHRNEARLEESTQRKETLFALLNTAKEPVEDIETKLAVVLERQLAAEESLTQARQALASIDHNLRELSEQRHDAEGQSETQRSQLERLRMSLENVKVRSTTIEEQLEEGDFNLKALLEEMPEEANESAWQEQIISIERRIHRLGPINLAAIDEFKEVSERKTYLDAQNDDLEKALTTLENAIQKIDRETRSKFKETYEIVNSHFKALFPKIFGGGSASLNLTGDDLLDTGVTVMARPPGKRNSTIHLLSGGEKALTALALVFSLFQINRAPFCMLDEVDAPLDDANVERFCNLVKEMSKELQFIFISHNKLAIEMGNQLIGVTMREPGVSRLVAVDVEQAVAMAEV